MKSTSSSRSSSAPGPSRRRPGAWRTSATARSPWACSSGTPTPTRRSSSSTATSRREASLPYLRFEGKKGDLRWDLLAADVTQKDQRYFLPLRERARRRCTGDYTGIPHNFGNGGKSLLGAGGRERLAPQRHRPAGLPERRRGRAVQRPDRLQLPAPVWLHPVSHLLQPVEARDRRASTRPPANIDLKLHPGTQHALPGLHCPASGTSSSA